MYGLFWIADLGGKVFVEQVLNVQLCYQFLSVKILFDYLPRIGGLGLHLLASGHVLGKVSQCRHSWIQGHYPTQKLQCRCPHL